MKQKNFKMPKTMKTMLYFSQNFPRDNFSAAHERTKSLLVLFLKNNYLCEFITPSKKTRNLSESLNHIFCRNWTLDNNNKNEMEIFLKKKKNLEFCFFDTFISEEFYSFYLHENFPNCLKILDTQDLHFLRKMRERKYFDFLKNRDLENVKISEILRMDEIDEKKDILFSRELSSIFRSDLVFLTSDFEFRFLTKNYNLKNLFLSRFYYNPEEFEQNEEILNKITFEKRKNFVWIGNFQHKPNFESVKILKKIWPQIKKKLPNAELHIYGSNFPKEFENLEKTEGIKKKNFMPNLKTLKKYKALLAPIFFGAGIKRKITDSWFFSLPVVTTLAGAEGLFYESYENDYSIRKFQEEKRDQRFFKPDREVGKSVNAEIDFLYGYDFENSDFNSKENSELKFDKKSKKKISEEDLNLKFGGSYFNDSFLIRYF